MNKEQKSKIEEFCKDTHACIEATSFEELCLWQQNASDSPEKYWQGFSWKQVNPGYVFEIGKIQGRPITIDLFCCMINNKKVIFWDLASILADFDMAKKWLRKNMPKTCLFTNAMNFHNADLK